MALGLAGVVHLLFFVMALVKNGLHTGWGWGPALAPFALGLTVIVSLTVRERCLRSHSVARAGVLAFLAAVPGIALTTWLFMTGADTVPHASSFLWLAQAVGAFGLAWLAGKVLPDRSERTIHGAPAVGDEQWLDELTVALRGRDDLSEQQVQARLDDVRSHLQVSGRPAAEEFGNPLGYARSLPGDQVVRTRRNALWWTSLVALWTFLAWGESMREIGWWRGGCIVLIVAFAVHAWWRHLQARRARAAVRR